MRAEMEIFSAVIKSYGRVSAAGTAVRSCHWRTATAMFDGMPAIVAVNTTIQFLADRPGTCALLDETNDHYLPSKCGGILHSYECVNIFNRGLRCGLAFPLRKFS